MKRTILTLLDKNGSSKDKDGRAYGFFLENEKQLCESYCKANGLTFKESSVNICDPAKNDN